LTVDTYVITDNIYIYICAVCTQHAIQHRSDSAAVDTIKTIKKKGGKKTIVVTLSSPETTRYRPADSNRYRSARLSVQQVAYIYKTVLINLYDSFVRRAQFTFRIAGRPKPAFLQFDGQTVAEPVHIVSGRRTVWKLAKTRSASLFLISVFTKLIQTPRVMTKQIFCRHATSVETRSKSIGAHGRRISREA